MTVANVTLEDIKRWNATREVRSMRTRNIRKMNKPYVGREVVFTCSNGWRIEKLVKADFPIEGFFMGHCLGTRYDHYDDRFFYSLREPDGTPHVTVHYSGAHGRGNMAPRVEYMALLHEWKTDIYSASISAVDKDNTYHLEGKLTDFDFRDLPAYAMYRGDRWEQKRRAL